MQKEEQKAVVSISETEPKIKRIDLLSNGSEGVKVQYESLEVRGGVVSDIKSSREYRRPVQRELRNYFNQLKEHLLRLTGYHWANDNVLELLMSTTNVNYIISDQKNGKFMIGGIKRIMERYKTALNTPNIAFEDYERYEDEVKEIFKKIMMETKLFIKGIKGADSRQVAVDYIVLKRELPESAAAHEFEQMSAEDQDKLMNEAFENYGLTIKQEDGEMVISMEEEETSESIENTGVSEDVDPVFEPQIENEEIEEEDDDAKMAELIFNQSKTSKKSKK